MSIRLARPLRELRLGYSQQINRGRELLARHVEREAEFSQLVADAIAWDNGNVDLVQGTYLSQRPDYERLPPLASFEEIGPALLSTRRDVSACLQQLDTIENALVGRHQGCLGFGS